MKALVVLLCLLTALPAFARPWGGVRGALQLTTNSLSAGVVGSSYSASLSASGGSGTGYVYSMVGCTPDSNLWHAVLPSGSLVGTPTNNETEACTYQVTDSSSNTAQATISFG